jgi:hypothetical protein
LQERAVGSTHLAAAVGNSMCADLTSVAGKLYKFGQGYGQTPSSLPRRIAIHADEFNELIGDEFIALLNKAGGAGFQVTACRHSRDPETWRSRTHKAAVPFDHAVAGFQGVVTSLLGD